MITNIIKQGSALCRIPAGRLLAGVLVLAFSVTLGAAAFAPAKAHAETKKSVLQCAAAQVPISINQNTTHPCVKALQVFLYYFKGYSIQVDGIYGLNSAFFVSIYQSKTGLAVDGIVGPNTWNQISNECRNTKEAFKILVCNVQV